MNVRKAQMEALREPQLERFVRDCVGFVRDQPAALLPELTDKALEAFVRATAEDCARHRIVLQVNVAWVVLLRLLHAAPAAPGPLPFEGELLALHTTPEDVRIRLLRARTTEALERRGTRGPKGAAPGDAGAGWNGERTEPGRDGAPRSW